MKHTRSQSRLVRAFTKEIESRLWNSPKGTFGEFARDLRRIERKYVVALEDNSALALEIRRRVAEYLLQSSVAHGCALRLCKEKLKRNLQLGFTDGWREVHFRTMFAEALVQRGGLRAGKRMLAEARNLTSELEKKGAKENKSQAETYRTWMSRLETALGETALRLPSP